MEYRLIPAKDSAWADPNAWSPTGPPGPDDVAVIQGGPFAHTVSGAAIVGKLWFPRSWSEPSLSGSFTTTAAAPIVGTRVIGAGVNLTAGSTLATGMLAVNGGALTVSGELDTSSTLVIGHAPGPGVFGRGALFLEQGVWTNTGNVVLAPAPGEGGAGDVLLSVDANSQATIGGDLRMQAYDSAAAGLTVTDSTLTVQHDLIAGAGTSLSLDAPSSELTVDGKLALQTGSDIDMPDSDLSAAIHAGTITLAPSATFIGGGTLAGPGATDGTTIHNQGTIKAGFPLVIDGSIFDHGGTLVIGKDASLTVSGSIWGQSVDFHVGGQLSAGSFGGGVTIHDFNVGDALTTPGITGLSYDPADHVLSLQQAGGGIERLHMAGSYATDAFVLGSNGAVTVT